MFAKVCRQHVDVDARPAQPVFQRLPPRLLLVRQLRKVEKSGVGGENTRFRIRDDEPVRKALHDFGKGRVRFLRSLGCLRFDRRKSGEDEGAGALPKERRRKNEFAIEASHTDGDAFASAGGPHRCEKILKSRSVGGIDQFKEGLSGNFLRRLANEREGLSD